MSQVPERATQRARVLPRISPLDHEHKLSRQAAKLALAPLREYLVHTSHEIPDDDRKDEAQNLGQHARLSAE
jgi:hypothetical protein